MPGLLKENTVIGTMLGGSVRIISRLGGGGQGDVYQVIYKGEKKALKWYRADRIYDLPHFVENLKRNIMNGRPTSDYLWPLDLTDVYEGNFGYVMDLCPDGFYEASEFIKGNVSFVSMRRKVDACLNIISAFRVLHAHGYSYKDINAGNFFISPTTGKVYICDNDNVAINGMKMGVLGTLNYMAPEIVLRKGFPDRYSDRHSLAVLLFYMLYGPHPLEGARSVNTVLDDNLKRSLFGSEALFVMDPFDHSNAPDPLGQPGLLESWNQTPEHIRGLFTRAFSQSSLRNPKSRPLETDWLLEFAQFRSEIIPCACGNEVCLEHGKPVRCEKCSREVRAPYVAEVRGRIIPVSLDMRILRCQLGHPRPTEALDIVAWVVGSLNNPNLMGMRNMGSMTWTDCTRSSGESFQMKRNEVWQIEDGIVYRVSIPSAVVPIRIKRN